MEFPYSKTENWAALPSAPLTRRASHKRSSITHCQLKRLILQTGKNVDIKTKTHLVIPAKWAPVWIASVQFFISESFGLQGCPDYFIHGTRQMPWEDVGKPCLICWSIRRQFTSAAAFCCWETSRGFESNRFELQDLLPQGSKFFSPWEIRQTIPVLAQPCRFWRRFKHACPNSPFYIRLCCSYRHQENKRQGLRWIPGHVRPGSRVWLMIVEKNTKYTWNKC